MIKSLRFFFILLLALSSYAQENSVFDNYDTLEKNFNSLSDQAKQLYNTITPSDEDDYETKIVKEDIPQTSLVLNAKEYQQKVYIDEIFPIDLEVITSTNLNFDLNISFEKSDDMLWINPNPIWQQKANSYSTTLWFQAKSLNATLDKIIIWLSRNDKIIQNSRLNSY